MARRLAWAWAVLLVACESSPGTVRLPGDPAPGEPADPPPGEPPGEPPPEPPPPEQPPPAAGGLLPDPEAPFALPPLQTEVPLYELEASPAVLAALDADPESDVTYPATFVHQGQRHPVVIRYRGNSSRGWPKKSWRIEFAKTDLFDGRHKLNLLSEWRDQTQMVEKLGYDLLAAMGGVASRARFVRLAVNGQERGVWLDLERVDKNFLANHGFADPDGTIYRCGRKDCEMKEWRAEFQTAWMKETNELQPGMDDLAAFLHAIHAAPEPTFPATLAQHLELELYLRMMVADALISNDTIEDSRSYLIHDAVTGRWHYAPWDINNSTTKYQPGSNPGKQADADQPLFVYTATNGWSEVEYQKRRHEAAEHQWHALFSDLSTRIQFHPDTRARLVARLDQALATLYTAEKLEPRIDAMHALIAPYVANDRFVEPALFADAPRYLKDFTARRRTFLLAEVAKLKAQKPSLLLEEVDPGAGRVVLKNLGDDPVPLAGWILTTNLRVRPLPNLPAVVVDPGEAYEIHGVPFASPGPVPEIGLWRGPAVDQVADLLFVGDLAPGQSLKRDPADPSRWTLAQ
jgi:spore coat protein H